MRTILEQNRRCYPTFNENMRFFRETAESLLIVLVIVSFFGFILATLNTFEFLPTDTTRELFRFIGACVIVIAPLIALCSVVIYVTKQKEIQHADCLRRAHLLLAGVDVQHRDGSLVDDAMILLRQDHTKGVEALELLEKLKYISHDELLDLVASVPVSNPL